MFKTQCITLKATHVVLYNIKTVLKLDHLVSTWLQFQQYQCENRCQKLHKVIQLPFLSRPLSSHCSPLV